MTSAVDPSLLGFSWILKPFPPKHKGHLALYWSSLLRHYDIIVKFWNESQTRGKTVMQMSSMDHDTRNQDRPHVRTHFPIAVLSLYEAYEIKKCGP